MTTASSAVPVSADGGKLSAGRTVPAAHRCVRDDQSGANDGRHACGEVAGDAAREIVGVTTDSIGAKDRIVRDDIDHTLVIGDTVGGWLPLPKEIVC